jgi:hypothetical protein
VPAAISDAWIDDVTRDSIEPLELQNAFGAHNDDGGSTKIHHQKIQTSLHKNSSVRKKRMKLQGQPALDWNESCCLSGVMNSRALVLGYVNKHGQDLHTGFSASAKGSITSSHAGYCNR